MRSGSPGRGGGRADVGHEGTRMEGGSAEASPPRMAGRARPPAARAAHVASPLGDARDHAGDARAGHAASPTRAGRRRAPGWPGSTASTAGPTSWSPPADGIGAAGRRHRRRAASAAATCWADDDELVVAAADGRLVVVARRRRRRAGAALATADALAPGGLGARRGRVRDRARRRVRRRDRAARRLGVAASGSRTPTTRGTRRGRPTVATLVWHEWDLPDMPWDASRIVRPRRRGRRRRVVAGGDAVACGQPRFSPDGAQLAFVRCRRLADVWIVDADGATRSRCSPSTHEHAEPAWGPGPAFVRVVARRRRARVVPQRGRLRPARDRRARPQVGARAVEGLAPRPRLGRARASSCVRSGAVTPPQVVVLAANGSGRRAIARGPVGGFERPAWSSRGRSRGSRGARPCTACCGGRADAPTDAAAARRARARRADRPGAGRLEPARAVARAAGLGGAAAELPRARPATARAYRKRSTGGGASATSPTSPPGSGTR